MASLDPMTWATLECLGLNTVTANTAKCSANCSGSELEKVVFCYKLMFIPRESCCLTHASPNFAICTRLSNPFAIQIFSWAWPRARSKNAVRERFTLGVRGATSIKQKLRGHVKLKYFNSTGSS